MTEVFVYFATDLNINPLINYFMITKVLSNGFMQKVLIILVVMLGSLETQAQKISNIETTRNWYHIYDDSGKKINSVSTTIGELKGYSADFYIMQHDVWIHTYSPTGKKLHTFTDSSVGRILSVTGDSFTSQKGVWIHTWSKDGKKISTRPAR